MTNHDFAKENRYRDNLGKILENGYKVCYEDNYVGWCPENEFEKAYKRLNIDNADNLIRVGNDNENTFVEHDNT